MERTITRIDGNVITLDAPLVAARPEVHRRQPKGTNTVYKYTAARLE
jgi:hypothetical protein